MVMLTTATLVLALCQTQDNPVQPQAPKPVAEAPRKDVIQLVGGEEIIGTIVKQAGNYIEVRIDASTVIGFERSRVRRIVRGNTSGVPQPKPALTARDDWFLLHDASGKSVGYVHGLTQLAEDGSLRVSEEWYFTGEKKRTQVTIMEVVDAELFPRTCFYHERVLSDADRLLSERLVNAELRGSRLHVVTRSLRGRLKKVYDFDAAVRFPLTYREGLRQDRDVTVHTANQVLFDPRDCEFRVHKARSVGRRKVELNGKQVTVREITVDDGVSTNSEWIDAEGRVVRREVNGAALVAVRVSKARALHAAVYRGETGFGSAVVATEAQDLALWLPNPIWRSDHRGKGIVTVVAPLYSASVALMELTQIPASVQLASAVDTVERWLRLTVSKDLKVHRRDPAQVRRLPAVQLRTAWRVDRQGESRAFKGLCTVFRMQGRYLAVVCATPRENFAALEMDFLRILESVQLAPQEIEPTLQGPLSKTAK